MLIINVSLCVLALIMLRSGVLSIGAFALGIAFEKHFNIYADLKESPKFGDVVDGSSLNKPLLSPPPMSPQLATIAQHGLPTNDSLRIYKNFVLSYDSRNRVANWVLEHLTPAHLDSKDYDRSGLDFFEDRSIHHFFRSTNDDYRKSGFDRGHLAASGNYRTDKADSKSTFILSNIAPQVGKGFNRDKWNDLENHIRSNIVKQSEHTWVCTGPVYLPKRDSVSGKTFVTYQVIGRNHVAVPTHFFKIILYQQHGKYYLESYLMPNQIIDNKQSIFDFRINPEAVERAAGFLFFNNIPRKQITIKTGLE